ncbi:MAG: RNA pyrophosphohydrolase [Sphingomonas sp.]|nr:RNA pyrophosphohydrolase [Sphingomonas sp.]
MTSTADLTYRPCAGIIIVNASGKLFVGLRIDTKAEAWQLPQGGIDDGEDAEVAALRELGEETGIAPDKVALVAAAPGEYRYDLPDELVGKVWKGRWRGQRMRWFLYRFLGEDSDIDIATAHPEFRAWRWADPAEIVALAVPFKRALYTEVLADLAPHLATAQ